MLSDTERAILDLEGKWWKLAATKEQAIRDGLGMTTIRYYQMLNALLQRPEALAYSPVVVNRLRRRLARR